MRSIGPSSAARTLAISTGAAMAPAAAIRSAATIRPGTSSPSARLRRAATNRRRWCSQVVERGGAVEQLVEPPEDGVDVGARGQ